MPKTTMLDYIRKIYINSLCLAAATTPLYLAARDLLDLGLEKMLSLIMLTGSLIAVTIMTVDIFHKILNASFGALEEKNPKLKKYFSGKPTLKEITLTAVLIIAVLIIAAASLYVLNPFEVS